MKLLERSSWIFLVGAALLAALPATTTVAGGITGKGKPKKLARGDCYPAQANVRPRICNTGTTTITIYLDGNGNLNGSIDLGPNGDATYSGDNGNLDVTGGGNSHLTVEGNGNQITVELGKGGVSHDRVDVKGTDNTVDNINNGASGTFYQSLTPNGIGENTLNLDGETGMTNGNWQVNP